MNFPSLIDCFESRVFLCFTCRWQRLEPPFNKCSQQIPTGASVDSQPTLVHLITQPQFIWKCHFRILANTPKINQKAFASLKRPSATQITRREINFFNRKIGSRTEPFTKAPAKLIQSDKFCTINLMLIWKRAMNVASLQLSVTRRFSFSAKRRLLFCMNRKCT